jgi:uncharacterized protein YdgA (DUF945 family)
MDWFNVLDLDYKVFGGITYKEILGETPAIEDLEKGLADELDSLVTKLKGITETELQKLHDAQLDIKRQLGARFGSMALPQNKIRLFMDYNQKYLEILNQRISSF